MRLLLLEERNAVTEAALERMDVENEEQELIGIVVVVVRESEACGGANSRYGESFVGVTSAAPSTALMLYLGGD